MSPLSFGDNWNRKWASNGWVIEWKEESVDGRPIREYRKTERKGWIRKLGYTEQGGRTAGTRMESRREGQTEGRRKRLRKEESQVMCGAREGRWDNLGGTRR